MTSERGGSQPQSTILVVDDDDGVRAITKQALEMFGYRVIEALDGEDAIERARLEMPDLILMDLSMPNLDGLAAVRRICHMVELRDVPIIAVTAHTSDEIHADALAVGCRDFITKPLRLEELKRAVARHLKRGHP